MRKAKYCGIFAITVAAMLASAVSQEKAPCPIAEGDTSYIDAAGTAHVTRVVPVPTTISPQAQKVLAEMERAGSHAVGTQSLAQQRANIDAQQSKAGKRFLAMYPLKGISQRNIADVPVKIVTPLVSGHTGSRVLIYIHGGGFMTNSGVLTSSIPIADLSRTKVIVVMYRLAPEHPFPAAVDDVIAVYKELLKTYKSGNIGVYGTSAGAVITAEVAIEMRKSGLPLPGALGIFSGSGDFSRWGDSQAMYTLHGLSGHLNLKALNRGVSAYVGSTPATDPVLSPLYADLTGLPPSLFITSTRDTVLSNTTILHRAFLRAGDDARLVVFEALPHTFWNNPNLPESKEADEIIASFFDKELGRAQ